MRLLAARPERLALALAVLSWGWMLAHAMVARRFACCAPAPAWPEDLLAWLAMIAAMMLPTKLAQLRDVAARSYRARRVRAAVAYVLGYLAWWLALGIAACLARQLGVLPGATACALFAAAWVLVPARALWRRRCHRRIPLHPTTWRADLSAFHHGAAHGAPCAAMCWPMMIACAAANHHVAMMLACTVLVMFEARMLRPRRGPIIVGTLAIAALTLAL
ncbi:MAG: DUF2182 domain-containing protein [Deltaproteobacteria bacterium]|nr:MAG: DUF2182 domain-containing protein [Deltaproteobacteria bacterium]